MTAAALDAVPLGTVSLSTGSTGVSPLWYATRATGVVALLLLTATVIMGIAAQAGLAAPGLPRVVTGGLHRNVSLLVLAFVVAHVLTAVLDSYTPIGLVSAVVPFSSAYRPLWLSLGAVAFDLLLALALTSLVRDRLSYRTWRAVHWLAYACWPVALWHGLGTGTDSRLPWLLAVDAVCLASVAAAATWRLARVPPGNARSAAIAGAALLPLATVTFVAAGPLAPGWARRAGTPTALLGSVSTPASTATASPGVPSAALPAAGAAAFAGPVSRAPGPGAGQVTITVRGSTSGTPARMVTIVLRGAPDGAGIAMSAGSVQLSGSGQEAAYQGPVTALNGDHLAAVLHSPAGPARSAAVLLNISGNRASGQLSWPAPGQP